MESRYVVRRLRPDELEEAGRLRHSFFVKKKGWAPSDPRQARPGIELDAYDRYSIHLGVFDGTRLVGYMRALSGESPVGFMLDRDFRECLTDEEYGKLIRPGSVELSRRVMAEDLGVLEARPVAGLLFKLFYVVCVEEKFSNVYLVQEPSYRAMLERWYGLPFTPVNAKPYVFADGTTVNVDHASIDGLLSGLEKRGLRGEYEAFLAASRVGS